MCGKTKTNQPPQMKPGHICKTDFPSGFNKELLALFWMSVVPKMAREGKKSVFSHAAYIKWNKSSIIKSVTVQRTISKFRHED